MRPRGPQKLPPGMTVEAVAREAIALRNSGIPVTRVAERLGIAKLTCAQMIDVVLIADRTDLPPHESELAASALHAMNQKLETLDAICESIAPIARRLWGMGLAARGSKSRPQIEAQRVERFEHALGMLIQACSDAARIDVPHLAAADAASIRRELADAIHDVETLSDKIGSIHSCHTTMKNRTSLKTNGSRSAI